MIYFTVSRLSVALRQSNTIDHIATVVSQELISYESLIKAETSLVGTLKGTSESNQKTGFGIVQLDMSIYDFNLLKKNPEKIKSKIVKIHFKGGEIDADNLDNAVVEKEHIRSLNYNPKNKDWLVLNEPALHYLSKIPNDLRYLYFIDFEFFEKCKDSWKPYNDREPGCVLDLFKTQVKICDVLTNPFKEKLTLEHVIDLHKSLSTNVFRADKVTRSGKLRDEYNAFSLNTQNVTFQGMVELLHQIQKDDNPDGFMLGEIQKTNILSLFFENLSKAYKDELENQKPPPTKYFELFYEEAKENAIREIMKNLKERKIDDISKKTVIEIINSLTADVNINSIIQVCEDDYHFNLLYWSRVEQYFYGESSRAEKGFSKEEYLVELKRARKNSLINNTMLKNLSAIEIEQHAKKIVSLIKEKDNLFLFPPESKLAEKKAREAIEKYNIDIEKSKTPTEIIRAINEVVHELEMLHLFYDVNCRTVYAILNEQLQLRGIKPTMLYDPNRLECFSADERIKEIELGICRFEYVIINAKKLSDLNRKLDKKNEQDDTYYTKMTNPLQEKFDFFNKGYEHTILNIGNFINTLNESSQSSILFAHKLEPSPLQAIFNEFTKDRNLRMFLDKIDNFNTSSMPPEKQKEFSHLITSLKNLTNFNVQKHPSARPTRKE